MELNELYAGQGYQLEGFVKSIGRCPLKYDEIPRDRHLLIEDVSMDIDDIFLYVMNGLYLLKEGYKDVYVSIFKSSYVVSVEKFAIPAKDDSRKVLKIMSDAILSFSNNNAAVKAVMDELAALIESGEMEYVL